MTQSNFTRRELFWIICSIVATVALCIFVWTELTLVGLWPIVGLVTGEIGFLYSNWNVENRHRSYLPDLSKLPKFYRFVSKSFDFKIWMITLILNMLVWPIFWIILYSRIRGKLKKKE